MTSDAQQMTREHPIHAWHRRHKLVLCDDDGTVVGDVPPGEGTQAAEFCRQAGRGFIKYVPSEASDNAR